MLDGAGASGTARVCARAAGIAAATIAAKATAVVIFDTLRLLLKPAPVCSLGRALRRLWQADRAAADDAQEHRRLHPDDTLASQRSPFSASVCAVRPLSPGI